MVEMWSRVNFLCVKPKLVPGVVEGSFTCSFSAIRMKTFLSGSNMMVILGYS